MAELKTDGSGIGAQSTPAKLEKVSKIAGEVAFNIAP